MLTPTECKVVEEESGKVITRGLKNVDKLYVLINRNSYRNKKYSSSSLDLE